MKLHLVNNVLYPTRPPSFPFLLEILFLPFLLILFILVVGSRQS